MKEVHKIRLTKSFTFEMAHALTGYDGGLDIKRALLRLEGVAVD